MRAPGTPKQPQVERLRDWYPYHAGFSSSFVEGTLTRHFARATALIDPWNGSGTTTAMAAVRGLSFTGLDINPAVTIIARARLTPASIRSSLEPLADEIVRAAQAIELGLLPHDPLQRWLRAPAVVGVRQIQRGINEVLVGESDLEKEMRQQPSAISAELPLLAAFFYAALFAATRDLLRSYRSTNPTWLRYPESYRHKISPSTNQVADSFRLRVAFLAERLTVPDESTCGQGSVTTASVLDLKDEGVYDACLTSPPYATRVDYVRSSLAELSVMGLHTGQVDELKMATTGTPRVRGIAPSNASLSSQLAQATVQRVWTHPSHGSSGYYGPWLRNYLQSLERSLERIHIAVSPKGRIGLVIQDSYYKSVQIDLQEIVTQTLTNFGRARTFREDHGARHLFSRINPAAGRHLGTRTNCESLLVFA